MRGAGLTSFEYFPAGACGDASIFPGQFLPDDGLGDWEYVKGDRVSDQHTQGLKEREFSLTSREDPQGEKALPGHATDRPF